MNDREKWRERLKDTVLVTRRDDDEDDDEYQQYNLGIQLDRFKIYNTNNRRSYLPTPPLGQDMTQGQFF